VQDIQYILSLLSLINTDIHRLASYSVIRHHMCFSSLAGISVYSCNKLLDVIQPISSE